MLFRCNIAIKSIKPKPKATWQKDGPIEESKMSKKNEKNRFIATINCALQTSIPKWQRTNLLANISATTSHSKCVLYFLLRRLFAEVFWPWTRTLASKHFILLFAEMLVLLNTHTHTYSSRSSTQTNSKSISALCRWNIPYSVCALGANNVSWIFKPH